VPQDQTDKYGIVDADAIDERSARIRFMVEKPKPADAPSNLAVVGRYVLPGRIFQLLEQTKPGAGGEIQLTDAIEALLMEQGKVLAYRFEGTRFDCGNKAGLVRATMHMALQDPSLAKVVREVASTL
jgi:UTP--glucose-1-phosphate uridylyltransferase